MVHSSRDLWQRDFASLSTSGAKASNKDEAHLGQTEAADVKPMKLKKRKRLDQESKGVHEQTAEEKAQSRLASFAKPTLAGPRQHLSTQKGKEAAG